MTTQVIGMFIIAAVVVIVGLVLFVANARYSREEFGRTKALDETPDLGLMKETPGAEELPLEEETIEEELEDLEDLEGVEDPEEDPEAPEEVIEDLEEIAAEETELPQDNAAETEES
ncbi:MAG: hypothetical protein K0S30_2123 [Clostridia bacterium]|jgi:hypothetical protein|nr:hypothetical protein [Clostridia bacterium]